jgi:hypothetical protein
MVMWQIHLFPSLINLDISIFIIFASRYFDRENTGNGTLKPSGVKSRDAKFRVSTKVIGRQIIWSEPHWHLINVKPLPYLSRTLFSAHVLICPNG